MRKQKVLAFLCHPDDEIICGWPILQNPNIDRHLVILCSDVHRKGPNRRRALEEVCKQENITLQYCADFDNNFYSLPTRRADVTLSDVCDQIGEIISICVDKLKPDYVMTHNPCGEYGNGSHRLCFQLVSQHPETSNVIFTDICTESNHRSHDEIPRSVRCAYYRKQVSKQAIQLDGNFYNRTKAVYDLYGAWTWDFPPIDRASLFIINETE